MRHTTHFSPTHTYTHVQLLIMQTHTTRHTHTQISLMNAYKYKSPKRGRHTSDTSYKLLGLEEALEMPHLPESCDEEDEGLSDGPP